MRRLLTNGLVVFAGVVVLPARVADLPQPRPQYREDPRLQALRKFFRINSSPAEHYSEEFLKAADAQRLDWRLLPSISLVESGGGRVANENNLFGWDSGRATFRTVADSIHHVAFSLSQSRLYKDKSLDHKLRVYNRDTSYGPLVKSVMRKIGSTPRLSTSSRHQ